MASSSFFAGTSTVRPVVRTVIDDAGLSPFTIGSPRIVACLGQALGGIPKVGMRFSTPAEAKRILRGGDLLRSILLAFDPSADNAGAQEVLSIRVAPTSGGTPCVRAAGTDKDAASTNSIVLTSVNYGASDNQIRRKYEVATIPKTINGVSHGLRVTVELGQDSYVKDNLYRESFRVQYVGAGLTCTMTITATALAFDCSTNGDDVTFQFADYPTVQALVAAIDAHAKYEATIITKNIEEPTASALDFATGVDVKTAAWTVTADLEEILKWYNSGAQLLVTAVRASGAGQPPAAGGFAYLTGGSDGGAPSNGDWDDAFTILEAGRAAFVVPVTGSAAIHAMASTHCDLISRDGSRPRRAFVGGVNGERTVTLGNYINRAGDLNDDRVGHVAFGLERFDLDGQPVVFPPYIIAAAVAGLQAGVATIGEPITRKSIKAIGLEWIPSSSDIEVLIGAGLIVVEFVEAQGFFRISRGVSTWRKNNDFHRVEISTGIALDEVRRAVTEGLDTFLGKPANAILVNQMGARTKAILRGLAKAGIIVGDDASPPFGPITTALEGDVASISFRCSPVVPLNFINVTIHADTFRSTVVTTID